jgi:hypothetical protein
MNELRRLVLAEMLKMRRTLALRVSIGVPLAVLSLQVVIASQRPAVPAAGENPFVSFAQNALMLWTLLVLPLHGALVAALVAMVDHEQNHWKQLLAQPVSVRRLILAKWVVVLLLLLTSFLVLLAGILGLEEGLRWARPGWRSAAPPVLLTASVTAQSFLAAGFFVSVHTWISLRARSFIAGPVTGVVAVLIMLGGAARLGAGSLFIRVYPWALPITAVARFTQHTPSRLAVTLLGALGGVIIAAIACWDLGRREWA